MQCILCDLNLFTVPYHMSYVCPCICNLRAYKHYTHTSKVHMQLCEVKVYIATQLTIELSAVTHPHTHIHTCACTYTYKHTHFCNVMFTMLGINFAASKKVHKDSLELDVFYHIIC